MKSWNYISALFVSGVAVAVLAATACGGDDSDTTSGAGGSTGDTTSKASVSSSKASVSSSAVTGTGTGGMMGQGGACDSGTTFDMTNPDNPVFDGCITENCCTSFDPCFADGDCSACLQDPTATGCDANALYMAFSTCQSDKCPGNACGAMLGYGSPNLNLCITASCCTTFTPCEADTTCNACLQDPMTAGCDTLALFTDYQTCKDTNCPSDICGTQIHLGVTYPNMSKDTDFAQTLCLQTNCCTELTGCADPTGDGFVDMDPESTACVMCLQDIANCAAGPVKTAADMFNTCLKAKCP